MEKKVLYTLVLIACITGCEAVKKPYYYWHKEGASTQVKKDLLGYCRTDVRANDLSENQGRKMVNYCMKSKGFVLKKAYR